MARVGRKGGPDIDGSSAGDQSGYSISLSADGNTLAVGSLVNDTGGQDSGQTRIFDWNGAAWQQRGADIYGEAEGDISSRGLSLSADGNTVAIGAVSDDGNGIDLGQTRVYEWLAAGTSTESVAHTQITSFASATRALSSLDLAVSEINARRATFGAAANRLEYAAENLSNVIMNTQAACSRVMDTDYAKETTELARTHIFQQAATVMLAQTNVQAKQVLTLLEGVSRS